MSVHYARRGEQRRTKSSSSGPSRRGPRWPDICQASAYCCMKTLKSSLASIDSMIPFNPCPSSALTGAIVRASFRSVDSKR